MGLQMHGLLLSERPAVRIRLRTLFQKIAKVIFPCERRSSHFSFGTHRQNHSSLRFECTSNIRKRLYPRDAVSMGTLFENCDKRGILPLQKSTFPYICVANKGKCFCFAHYEVTIAKDTVNSQ